MFDEIIEMQLVLQPAPGRTVTVKELVAALPHWSVAVTMTVVVELSGKQVVSGGLKISVAPETVQQLSTAKVLYATVVQLLQVWATTFAG
jgi:hypothetical protein